MVMKHGTLDFSIIMETDAILAHLQLKEKKTKQKIIWEMPTLFCINLKLLLFVQRFSIEAY